MRDTFTLVNRSVHAQVVALLPASSPPLSPRRRANYLSAASRANDPDVTERFPTMGRRNTVRSNRDRCVGKT